MHTVQGLHRKGSRLSKLPVGDLDLIASSDVFAPGDTQIKGGRVLGTTPLRGAAIDVDPTVLVIRAPQHQPRTIRIRRGRQPVRLRTVALERLAPATLQLTVLSSGGSPVPAHIVLDGKAVGEAPLVLRQLAPGHHVVEARREGVGRARRSLKLEPGQTYRVALRLK